MLHVIDIRNNTIKTHNETIYDETRIQHVAK